MVEENWLEEVIYTDLREKQESIVMGLKLKNKYFDKTWKCLELNGQKGKSPMRDLEVW